MIPDACQLIADEALSRIANGPVFQKAFGLNGNFIHKDIPPGQ
jgi:hypothetical protein